MVLWKTMAPVMLPMARVSLLSLSQMTELNFSGKLRGQGRQDQRDDARRDTDGQREVLHGSHEEVGAEAHHHDRPYQLRGDGPGRRPELKGHSVSLSGASPLRPPALPYGRTT